MEIAAEIALPESRGGAEFTLPWPPSVNAAYRSIVVGRASRVVLSREGRDYKQRAAWELAAQRVPGFGHLPVSVEFDVYPPDRRARDLDNVLKLAQDALQPAVLTDDAQIVRLLVTRCKVRPGGLLVVRVALAESV